MEWGKQRLAWLLLGHLAVSQMANQIARKVRLYAPLPFKTLSPLLFVKKEP